jgi:hypothetical protein
MFNTRQIYFTLFSLFCTQCFAVERYAAMFADGTRAEEADVREWCEPAAQPKIGGRALFDPQVPVRWIIDRSQNPASKPTKYIEFAGGDRLAAEVVSFADGQENPYEIRPPHLKVKTAVD